MGQSEGSAGQEKSNFLLKIPLCHAELLLQNQLQCPEDGPCPGGRDRPSWASPLQLLPAASSTHPCKNRSSRGCTGTSRAAARQNSGSQRPAELKGPHRHWDASPAPSPLGTRPRSQAACPVVGICTPGLWSQGKRLQSLPGAGASPGEAAGAPSHAWHGFCSQNFPSPAWCCRSPRTRQPRGSPKLHRPILRERSPSLTPSPGAREDPVHRGCTAQGGSLLEPPRPAPRHRNFAAMKNLLQGGK